eukprot:5733063-Amphidinium_carterae.1
MEGSVRLPYLHHYDSRCDAFTPPTLLSHTRPANALEDEIPSNPQNSKTGAKEHDPQLRVN